ncbi:hypothetical protein AURDEDRAFT_170323 [Auricularia subglabra TFB-10046 SS5]|nr:hypothetical protein AURDEDRAFT_170323 [Auricularia subglabra TFB-10046 SS5]
MIPSDKQALEELVLSICLKAPLNELSACDAQAVVDDILNTARTSLANACYVRNQLMQTCTLPPEILADCFALLPMRDRITVSHVSRVWRTVALDAPFLWNDMTSFSQPRSRSMPLMLPLMRVLLARSGGLPIHLEYNDWIEGDVIGLILPYLHRIASMTLHFYQDLSFLNHPAPLLHTLRLKDVTSISDDFLARTAGRLAIMHAKALQLPNFCPPLATLTELTATLSSKTTLQALFAMCPRLQTLSLSELCRENVADVGRSPQFLSTLALSTFRSDCDLIAVYDACKDSISLKSTDLRCDILGLSDDFGRSLYDALELTIDCKAGRSWISVTILFAGGRRIALSWSVTSLQYLLSEWLPCPPFLTQPMQCLAYLHTLTLPLAVLPQFIKDEPQLPQLSELRVQIPRPFEWFHLAKLRDFTACRVVCLSFPQQKPTPDDGRVLLAYLSRYAAHLVFTVRGFAADAVPDNAIDSPNVTFLLD